MSCAVHAFTVHFGPVDLVDHRGVRGEHQPRTGVFLFFGEVDGREFRQVLIEGALGLLDQ